MWGRPHQKTEIHNLGRHLPTASLITDGIIYFRWSVDEPKFLTHSLISRFLGLRDMSRECVAAVASDRPGARDCGRVVESLVAD